MLMDVECPECCGNGQTYRLSDGADIICPVCDGAGCVLRDLDEEAE